MKALYIFLCLLPLKLAAQFTHADTLRGSNGPGRSWWNATHYDLSVKFDEKNKTISGCNVISFTSLVHPEKTIARKMQIDLQEPLLIDSIVLNGRKLAVSDEGNAHFTTIPDVESGRISVYYHGTPRVAKTPPWDGGLVWSSANGLPWISIACQGLGASVWYPCKDYQGDEPDSAAMHFTVRKDLKCVSNGRFTGSKENSDGTTTFSWKVVSPINNYDIIPYIGDYVNIHEHIKGEKGPLEMDYWVLRGNEEKAKKQFKDAPRTIEALEFWFGPYPFYEDGYKLVEAPYLGMEHQSAVAYGNRFQNGYLGTDLSGTGIGMKWDFIIVHESGHEWFGNNITSKDIADMWVHEGFTNYSEELFTEYWFGKKAGEEYVIGLRKNIENDKPIIGPYGVNEEGSGDMYYKGANMLHTIRHLVDNDTLFRKVLRGLNRDFCHQTVTTQQIEDYLSKNLNMDLSKIFDQYLRATQPPKLAVERKGDKIRYKWDGCVKGFDMKLRLANGEWIYPTSHWKAYDGEEGKNFQPDLNFYILQAGVKR